MNLHDWGNDGDAGFSGGGLDFREADRLYEDLRHRRDAGEIGDEEFDDQRKGLMVRDAEGRWWARSQETGGWMYHDGDAWWPGSPPGYEQSAPDRSENRAGDREEERDRRDEGTPGSGRGRLALVAACVLVVLVAGISVAALGLYLRNSEREDGVAAAVDVEAEAEEGAPEEESPAPKLEPEEEGPAPGYDLVEDDSGSLSAEVPSEWSGRITGKEGTLEGVDVNAGEGVGPGLTASPDLEAWTGGSNARVPGIYLLASRELASSYNEDQLAGSGFNDLSSGCVVGARQDFDRYPYSGRVQRWSCAGEGSTRLTLAAAPEGRECVVMANVVMYAEADEESARHVLDTFEADCGSIN